LPRCSALPRLELLSRLPKRDRLTLTGQEDARRLAGRGSWLNVPDYGVVVLEKR